jgi:hypothetical protein
VEHAGEPGRTFCMMTGYGRKRFVRKTHSSGSTGSRVTCSSARRDMMIHPWMYVQTHVYGHRPMHCKQGCTCCNVMCSTYSPSVRSYQLDQGVGDAVDAFVIEDSHAWCPLHVHT